MIKLTSGYDFQQTRARLLKGISDNNLVLFGEFDHAQAAADAQLAMPPTTVLIFGSPKGGTSLMLAHPDLALDMPFRVLISQQGDGHVQVSHHPVDDLLRAGVDAASIAPLHKLEQLVKQMIQ